GAYFTHVMRSLEDKTVDARFAIRGTHGPPKDIVLVEITDQGVNNTFNEIPLQWPFPRCLHAKVIDWIAKGDPKAIAVDIVFDAPSNDVAADGKTSCDDVLGRSIKNAGHVVLNAPQADENGHTRIFGGYAALKRIHAYESSSLIPTDTDGVVRHAWY